MRFNFEKLALPPSLNKRFKISFKSFFESISVQKTVSEVLKTWYFSYSTFGTAGQWGEAIAFLPPLATLLQECSMIEHFCKNARSSFCKKILQSHLFLVSQNFETQCC